MLEKSRELNKVDIETRKKRLLYRSWHRGCKETDQILGRFADANIEAMSEEEVGIFENLLEVDDVYIWRWLTGEDKVPTEFHHDLIDRLINFSYSYV